MPDDRAATRAELLPEEGAAGSDDPKAQAQQILAESDERAVDRDAAPTTNIEQRSSDEATPPV